MKKLVPIAAAAATAALLLAGCTNPGSGTTSPGGSGTSGTAGTTAAWPDQTASLSGVTLTVWAAQSSATEGAAVISAFEKATGATVKVVTIPDPYEQGVETKVATGDKPDLAFWQPTASMLTTLNATQNLLTIDDAPWLSSYQPDLKDITGILDGHRYATLITSPSVMGVYYNKKVFAANGITSTPKTFQEMVSDAQKLKSAGVTPFFEAGGDKWPTQWWVQVQLADAAKSGLWDQVNTAKEKFTDPTILGAITQYKSLIDQGLFNEDISSATFADQGTTLLSGDAAMVVQINAYLSELEADTDAATLDDTVGFFPISPSGNVGTTIPDQSNALVAFKTGDATREAAARQLLEYWMGQGYPTFVTDQKTVSLETSVPNATGLPQLATDVAAAVPDAAGSMQSLAVANPDLYLNLANMISGTMTPEQVASTTQDQFAQLAKAAGVSGF